MNPQKNRGELPFGESTEKKFSKLQENLGHQFHNRYLLYQALTHRSYVNEVSTLPWGDNERLEFLGDAVFELTTSAILMERFPKEPEGYLTQMRAAVVNEASLAVLAKELELPACILLGRGEEKSGGREKPALVADALEALCGALFLEGGYDHALAVLRPLLREMVEEIHRTGGPRDPKTRLQEVMWQKVGRWPVYELLCESGPSHARTYEVQVNDGAELSASGKGRSKKNAEQEAARNLLNKLLP